MNYAAKDFAIAYQRGAICLHPTDTIPGLTIHPKNSSAVDALRSLKGRANSQPLIGLVASFKQASDWWQPLPKPWFDLLSKSWPRHLSVIWTCIDRARVPDCFFSGDSSELCLRCPELAPSAAFFASFLAEQLLPVPTTSVNFHGQQSALTWSDAAAWTRTCGQEIYVPDVVFCDSAAGASTVVQIQADGSGTILRQGLCAIESLHGVCVHAKKIG